jgi:hypothetical protein
MKETIKLVRVDKISAQKFARAIRAIKNDIGQSLIEAHAASFNHTTTWQDLAEAVGMMSWRAVNAHYGRFAHAVGEQLGFVEAPKATPESERGYWVHTLVYWADELGSRGHTAFVLRSAVLKALSMI